MTLVNFANKILASGAIVGQLCIVVSIIYVLFFRKKSRSDFDRDRGSSIESGQHAIIEFLHKNGMILAFLVALASLCGSLFYSMVAGFAPCELCWYQRIFMYPLVFLLGLALIKKDSHIIDYALSLTGIGSLIALYHNYVYYYAGGLNVLCELSGMQVSCIKRYVFEFGYVTIPLMSLTAFLMIIILLIFKKTQKS